jgi:hypothetical protein
MKIGSSRQFGIFEKLGWTSFPSDVKGHAPTPHNSTIQVRSGPLAVKHWQVLPLVFGLLFAVAGGAVNAQTAGENVAEPLSRAQVMKERNDFYKSHRYDEATDNWVLRQGFEPPTGTMSRAEEKAERDAFISTHKYDPVTETWTPKKGAPRDVSKLTRAQVRAETRQFYRAHKWDEVKSRWVAKPAKRAKK